MISNHPFRRTSLLLLALALSLGPAAFGAGLTWQTGRYLPQFSAPAAKIDAIDLSSANAAEQDLFISLQGLANRQQPRIACVLNSAEEGEYTWMNLHGLSYDIINGFSAIIKYKSNVTGLVVPDTNQPDTLNLATTIAGVKNELICDASLLATLTNAPYDLPVVDDLRNLFTNKYQVYGYLYTNYWPQCTHRVIAGMETNGYYSLRDYLIAVKAAVVWLDPGVSADATALTPFISSMTPVGGVYMGWWPSEANGLQWIGAYGIPVIASDWFDNGSLFSGVVSQIAVPAIPPTPPLQNKVYVSLTLSDGDNVQYMQHYLYTIWTNSSRGKVPIGWTTQPIAADLDPGMLNYFWSTATSNDCLVTGPSGAGYTRINYWSAQNVANYTAASNPYLQRSGMRVSTVWDTLSLGNAGFYASNCPTLVGLNDQDDGYYTTNALKLPVLGFPSSASYAAAVSNLVSGITNTAASWNGTTPMFIAVQGDAWDLSPASCLAVANSLNTNEYVVVRPDHLFMLYRQAAGLGAGGAFPYVAGQPAGQVANPGSNVTLSVFVSGSSPLSYQWLENSSSVTGATNSTLIVPNAQASNAGNYSVVITNAYGSATSQVATLMINSGSPQIFSNVQTPFFAYLGQPFSNSVVAAGTAPLSYQWQLNGVTLTDDGRITGSQTSVLKCASTLPGDGGSYQVIVSNAFGSATSGPSALTVVGSLPTSFNGAGAGWQPSGSAAISGSNVLTLTSPTGLGGNGSFFFEYPQYIAQFIASFTYQAGGNKSADGVTFCIQNDPRGASALGTGGGNLGVGGSLAIAPSLELELNIYTGNTEKMGFTVHTNGLTGGGGANGNYTAPGSVNLAGGDPIAVTVAYSSGQLALTFTDSVTRTSFSTNEIIGDLTQIVGGSNAYVGFTGAYGGSTSVQTISNFTFAGIPYAAITTVGTNAVLTWPGTTAGYILQSSPDMSAGSWAALPNQAANSNNLSVVTVPLGASNQFYRLFLAYP